MVNVTFLVDGEARTLDVAEGTSLMKAAVSASVPGIIGQCGGNAMCATCHVYTQPEDSERLPELSEDEDEMLDSTAGERREGSRLSCQLVSCSAFDGLTVTVPADQL